MFKYLIIILLAIKFVVCKKECSLINDNSLNNEFEKTYNNITHNYIVIYKNGTKILYTQNEMEKQKILPSTIKNNDIKNNNIQSIYVYNTNVNILCNKFVYQYGYNKSPKWYFFLDIVNFFSREHNHKVMNIENLKNICNIYFKIVPFVNLQLHDNSETGGVNLGMHSISYQRKYEKLNADEVFKQVTLNIYKNGQNTFNQYIYPLNFENDGNTLIIDANFKQNIEKYLCNNINQNYQDNEKYSAEYKLKFTNKQIITDKNQLNTYTDYYIDNLGFEIILLYNSDFKIPNTGVNIKILDNQYREKKNLCIPNNGLKFKHIDNCHQKSEYNKIINNKIFSIDINYDNKLLTFIDNNDIIYEYGSDNDGNCLIINPQFPKNTYCEVLFINSNIYDDLLEHLNCSKIEEYYHNKSISYLKNNTTYYMCYKSESNYKNLPTNIKKILYDLTKLHESKINRFVKLYNKNFQNMIYNNSNKKQLLNEMSYSIENRMHYNNEIVDKLYEYTNNLTIKLMNVVKNKISNESFDLITMNNSNTKFNISEDIITAFDKYCGVKYNEFRFNKLLSLLHALEIANFAPNELLFSKENINIIESIIFSTYNLTCIRNMSTLLFEYKFTSRSFNTNYLLVYKNIKGYMINKILDIIKKMPEIDDNKVISKIFNTNINNIYMTYINVLIIERKKAGKLIKNNLYNNNNNDKQ